MNIKMRDLPRFTGKTATLKLLALEEMHKGDYDKICILAHCSNSEKILHRWLMEIKCQFNNIVVGIDVLEDRIKYMGKSKENHKTLVLIDEPFIMRPEREEQILIKLEELSVHTHIDVVGIGTLEKTEKHLQFKDYL